MAVTQAKNNDDLGQSVSVLVAVSLMALLLIAGLVIDGGAHAAATRRAEMAASGAARAAVDAGATARAAGVREPVADSLTAGRSVLRAAGVEGEVLVRGGSVRVTTTTTVPTVFLGIIGMSRLTAHGEATAVLVSP